MEITKPEHVTEVLLAKSQTRTLDEIRDQGADQVRVIRASDVASMISASVDQVLRDNKVLSDEDIEILVQRGPKEFKRVARERELDRQRAQQDHLNLQSELAEARARIAELEQVVTGEGGGAAAAAGGQPNAELMMRMMTEMAQMKAELAQAQQSGGGGGGGGGGADSVAEALGQISQNLNARLEQFGKKIGISSAVDARDINYAAIFDQADEVDESNMGDVEVKKKTGGGIAGNLARLKKLKGDG